MKIKILGHEYDVAFDDLPLKENNQSGYFASASSRIHIDNTQSQSRQQECFLHEVIEAINYHLELKLEHPQISALSEALYCVMKENKEVLCWTGVGQKG